MILSDRDLHVELYTGRIVVAPLASNAVQPASIDVRLGGEVLIVEHGEWSAHLLGVGNGFELKPGEFALGTTREAVTVPDDLLCTIHGRSSVGRTGLQVECAGIVDPGWRGQLTLELSNLSTRVIRLEPGMPIAQLVFHRLTSPARRPYGTPGLGSRYQDQVGPTPARPAAERSGQ